MTKIIKEFPVSKQELETFRKEKIKSLIQEISDFVQTLTEKFCSQFGEKMKSGSWIEMGNKDIFYANEIVSFVPNYKRYAFSFFNSGYSFNEDVFNKTNTFEGFCGTLPTYEEVLSIFDGGSENRILLQKALNDKDFRGVSFLSSDNYYSWWRFDTKNWGHYSNSIYYDMINFPIYRLSKKNSRPASAAQAMMYWFANDAIPDENEFATKKDFKEYQKLHKYYQKYKDYFTDENKGFALDVAKIYIAVTEENKTDLIPKLGNLLTTDKIDAYTDYVQNFEKQLLNCDHVRAMLDPYDRNLLYDPNRGHWDLWDYGEVSEPAGTVLIQDGMTAKDPAEDINSGIVAIDFGTKSTVVVYENDRIQILPLQVGNGNYGDGVNKSNYENPTVIQFIDIDSFVQAYNARTGRPFTTWDEITVSHTAFANLTQSSSDKYYSFFDGLKSWCGTDGKRVKIRDAKNKAVDLPPFLELVEGDLNPLEIYAYYLGLYMNNMLQEKHIFLQYIMSFPATYERGIREKMRRCFAAGIRKSLPTALLSNTEAMSRFRVQEGVSEPAAYAITALQEYGFDPSGEEKQYYAVFDFGGGTTDFDFGMFRESTQQDRYDYLLYHFGANGDRTLGGENLLALLAFEIFKFNREKLLHPDGVNDGNKIPFAWPADKKEFAGSEGLINDSQEAHANMHNLMEALRPIWEDPDSEAAKKIIESGFVSINLFKDNGKLQTNVTLTFVSGQEDDGSARIDIEAILRGRIEQGIKNFFIAMKEAFDNYSDNTCFEEYQIETLQDSKEIIVFLAGNSSKSTLVKELFNEYIDNKNKLAVLLGLDEESIPDVIIYPALGTDEAYDLQEELGLNPDRNKLENPTGKTGVAYGLLKCRESGNIKVINITPDEKKVPFQYYVGRNKKRKFKTVIDRNTKMGVWYPFIDASASFDLLYTDVPEASTNSAPVSIARQIHVILDHPEPDSTVYIRPVDSKTLEYIVAASEEDLRENKSKEEPMMIVLP